MNMLRLCLLVGTACVCVAMQLPAQAQTGNGRKLAEEKRAEEARASRAAVARNRNEVADLLPASPAPDVAALYAMLEEKGNREAVWICYQIAVNALNAGRLDEAERMLEAAYVRIEKISAGDAELKRGRSKYSAEWEKDFKGEPYEQMMVYLLRGLVYMQRGDFENARAIFRSGLLRDRSNQDAPADEQYHADMATFEYLIGLCNLKIGDPNAADAFRFARENARTPDAVLMPPDDFNSLILVLGGTGPRKYRTGEYLQYLRFLSGTGARAGLIVETNGQPTAAVPGPIDNCTFQATTRGGREIDAVLKGKAQFKVGTAVAGDLLVGVGASMAMSGLGDDSGAVGLALMLGGLVAKGASAAANPEADARTLGYVPDDIYVFPAALAPGEHVVTLRCPLTLDRADHRVTVPAGSAFNVAIIWESGVSKDVHALRLVANNDLVDSRSDWLEVWEGTLRKSDPPLPITLYIEEKGGATFTGYLSMGIAPAARRDQILALRDAVEQTPANTPGEQARKEQAITLLSQAERGLAAGKITSRVRGQLEDGNLEIRQTQVINGAPEEYLYLGNVRGKKITGDLYYVDAVNGMRYWNEFQLMDPNASGGGRRQTADADEPKRRGGRR